MPQSLWTKNCFKQSHAIAQWREASRLRYLRKNLQTQVGINEAHHDTHRGKTIRVSRVLDDLSRESQVEFPYAGTYWRKTSRVLHLPQSVRSQIRSEQSYAFAHGRPVRLQGVQQNFHAEVRLE